MKIDTKKSSKLFALAVGSLLISHAQTTHAQEDHAFDEIQTRAQTAAVSEYQAYQKTIARDIINDIQGSDRTVNLTTLSGGLADALEAITGTGFDSATDSLVAISTAISQISPESGVATYEQAEDIQGSAIGFAAANNSLAALAGTGNEGGSGSTNVFNPATNSLADMCGATFTTATDSLVNISNNTISVPFATTAQAEAIEGIDFDTTTDSLHSISNNTITVPFATTAQANAIQGLGFNTDTNSLTVISGGSAFVPADSLHSISNNTITVPFATTAALGIVDGHVTTLGTAALATSAQAVAIEGTGFDTTTDSLVNISNNTISVPFATTAQAEAIQGSGFATADNSLVAISAAIGNNVTAGGLYTILGLIVAQLIGDPIVATTQASTNTQLTDPVVAPSVDTTAYNTAIAAAIVAATIATTPATQNYANTVAAQTSLTIAQTAFDGLVTAMNAVPEVPTSAASLAQIQSAIGELQTALGYLLTQQQQ